ncbi:hypothetical protein [Oceanobacillus salinisoli]|uniref:hypothetical protein n=1 Tax=Oceanobacillus salinisoli TaxID=2678611 RepID=UPI0012E26DA7|nr:hypothetical protein [Oceanobacillus salinisoli]
MKKQDRHDELIGLLKNMPDIKNKTDKNILYQRISSNNNNTSENVEKAKRKMKLFPVLGSVLAVILIVCIPFLFNGTSFQTSEEQSNQAYDTQSTEDSLMEQESADESESAQEFEIAEESGESNVTEEENISLYSNESQFVLDSINDNANIVYAAISDEQFQYAIPITFVVSDSKNMNDHYNNLEQYLREYNLTTADYLLEGLSYNIHDTNKEVQISLPDDFSIESSARAAMFEKLLETMFIPAGIEKATFLSGSDEGVELGPYGEIDEMQLHDDGNASYKLYNDEFLVPIPHEGDNVEEAITEMKNNQEAFDIFQTIPNEIDFSIETFEDELRITYTGQAPLANDDQAIIMIEAILMTAKSYGFHFVNFDNMPLEQIGNYNFNEPIKVPEAVNPFDIHY